MSLINTIKCKCGLLHEASEKIIKMYRCEKCGNIFEYNNSSVHISGGRDFCNQDHYEKYYNNVNKIMHRCFLCDKYIDPLEIGPNGEQPVMNTFCSEKCVDNFKNIKKYIDIFEDFKDLCVEIEREYSQMEKLLDSYEKQLNCKVDNKEPMHSICEITEEIRKITLKMNNMEYILNMVRQIKLRYPFFKEKINGEINRNNK